MMTRLFSALLMKAKAEKFKSGDFKEGLLKDLKSDLDILKEIHKIWSTVKRDPKLSTFLDRLASNQILKKNKLIIFTESKETAEYLAKILRLNFPIPRFVLLGHQVRLSARR